MGAKILMITKTRGWGYKSKFAHKMGGKVKRAPQIMVCSIILRENEGQPSDKVRNNKFRELNTQKIRLKCWWSLLKGNKQCPRGTYCSHFNLFSFLMAYYSASPAAFQFDKYFLFGYRNASYGLSSLHAEFRPNCSIGRDHQIKGEIPLPCFIRWE